MATTHGPGRASAESGGNDVERNDVHDLGKLQVRDSVEGFATCFQIPPSRLKKSRVSESDLLVWIRYTVPREEPPDMEAIGRLMSERFGVDVVG